MEWERSVLEDGCDESRSPDRRALLERASRASLDSAARRDEDFSSEDATSVRFAGRDSVDFVEREGSAGVGSVGFAVGISVCFSVLSVAPEALDEEALGAELDEDDALGVELGQNERRVEEVSDSLRSQ